MKHLIVSLGLAGLLTILGCATARSPTPIPPQPSPFLAFDLAICLHPPVDNYCDGPAHATVTLDGTPPVVTDTNGYVYLTGVPASLRDSYITVTAPGFAPLQTPTVHPADLAAHNALGLHNFLVLTPARPFPPEAGPLHVSGLHFLTDQNEIWGGHSYSLFLVCGRLWAGEDIDPTLQAVAALGFNTVRVFGPVNWPDGFATPYEHIPSTADLDACFDHVQQAGLRIEYTPLTYAQPLDQERALVQRTFDAASHHWNTFVEVANEPEVNGVDPVTVMRGVDRHGVLSAYGLDPERVPGPNFFKVPVLDYATSHDIARDLAHSPRNSKDTRDAEDILHVPVWDDEPIGVIDPDRYGGLYRQGGPGLWVNSITGGGVRVTDCAITTAHAAIALTLTGLTTYHSQAGLEGRAPGPDEPIQTHCASEVGSLFGFIPPVSATGTYTRPGLANWPIAWTAGDTDSLVQHAYSADLGGTQYVVVPMPKPDWAPVPINGWRLDALGPVPYVFRVVR